MATRGRSEIQFNLFVCVCVCVYTYLLCSTSVINVWVLLFSVLCVWTISSGRRPVVTSATDRYLSSENTALIRSLRWTVIQLATQIHSVFTAPSSLPFSPSISTSIFASFSTSPKAVGLPDLLIYFQFYLTIFNENCDVLSRMFTMLCERRMCCMSLTSCWKMQCKTLRYTLAKYWPVCRFNSEFVIKWSYQRSHQTLSRYYTRHRRRFWHATRKIA